MKILEKFQDMSNHGQGGIIGKLVEDDDEEEENEKGNKTGNKRWR